MQGFASRRAKCADQLGIGIAAMRTSDFRRIRKQRALVDSTLGWRGDAMSEHFRPAVSRDPISRPGRRKPGFDFEVEASLCQF